MNSWLPWQILFTAPVSRDRNDSWQRSWVANLPLDLSNLDPRPIRPEMAPCSFQGQLCYWHHFDQWPWPAMVTVMGRYSSLSCDRIVLLCCSVLTSLLPPDPHKPSRLHSTRDLLKLNIPCSKRLWSDHAFSAAATICPLKSGPLLRLIFSNPYYSITPIITVANHALHHEHNCRMVQHKYHDWLIELSVTA